MKVMVTGDTGFNGNELIKKSFLCLCIFFFIGLSGNVWGDTESPLALPKTEGSKSFDLEISKLNSQAINKYEQGLFQDAAEKFKKALILSQQLRDPSQGILHYNLSLSLHKAGKHEEATKQFYSAKRFARGNSKILNSELLKMHECGFNPSIPCEKKIPLPMNIEGSH